MKTNIDTPPMTPTPEEIAAVESLLEPMVAHGTEYERQPTIKEMALRLRALMREFSEREKLLLGALKAVADEVRCYEDSPRSYSGDSYLPEKFKDVMRAAIDSARRAEARG